jgi:hypothetical protein
LREPDGETYAAPITLADLRVELKHQFSEQIDLIGHDGKLKSADALLVDFSVMAKKLDANYVATGTTWDAETRTLSAGYSLPSVEARHDPEVAAWLRGLAGDTDAGLADLYQWIASAKQSRLNSLAAVLVLVGDAGIGKTFFFVALAKLWGAEYVPFKTVVQQFNARIASCPIWLDDECEALKDGLVSSSRFRAIAAERTRCYEPKGKEKRELHGCARIGLTANDVSDISFPDVVGAGAVQAVADRLALYVVPRSRTAEVKAALDRLRLPGLDEVDVARIVGHFAWAQANTTIREQRFLGARADSELALTASLAGVVAKQPALFEMIRDYLAGGGESDLKYKTAVSRFSVASEWALHFPLVVHDGKLWAYPKAIQETLQLKDLTRVHAVLSAFSAGEKERPRIESFRAWLYPLDVQRLFTALGMSDAEAGATVRCLGTDTAKRRADAARQSGQKLRAV